MYVSTSLCVYSIHQQLHSLTISSGTCCCCAGTPLCGAEGMVIICCSFRISARKACYEKDSGEVSEKNGRRESEWEESGIDGEGERGRDRRRREEDGHSVLQYACLNFLQTLSTTCVPFGACGTTKLGLVSDWPPAAPQQRASTSVQPHQASADHCSLQWRCESGGSFSSAYNIYNIYVVEKVIYVSTMLVCTVCSTYVYNT